MTICVRCMVSGKVQGVFFRAATRQQAVQLGIQGYARNHPDGRVEVLACGKPAAIGQLKAWLTKGPPAARVSGVTCEPVPAQTLQGFSTR
jgi:acylphosphatase